MSICDKAIFLLKIIHEQKKSTHYNLQHSMIAYIMHNKSPFLIHEQFV